MARILVLCFMIISLGITGCTDGKNGKIISNDTLIVSDGVLPVWFHSGDRFLYSLSEDLDSSGIYLRYINSELTYEVWSGAHNFDYVPSYNNSYVAFSTPELEGGVYVYSTATREAEVVIPGGKNPSWLMDGPTLIAENDNGSIVYYDMNNENSGEVLSSGFHPEGAPEGPRFAYYKPASFSFGHPYELNISSVNNPGLIDKVAEKALPGVLWSPNGYDLYVPVSSTTYQSNLIRIDLQQPAESDTLLYSVKSPSLGGGGTYILATEISSNKIVIFDLETVDFYVVSEFGYRSAGHPVEKYALIEKKTGIYKVNWVSD